MTMKVRGYPYYAVEGRGHFPVDMLRYDESLPHGDSSKRLSDPDLYHEKRVRLIMQLTPHGYGFTPARWSSFGWNVVACAKTMAALGALLENQPIPFAPPDGYTHLYSVPVVAETALNMKADVEFGLVSVEAPNDEAERKAFEEWAHREWGATASLTDNMWLAWKGRAALDKG